jgi:hypothetical protein
MELARRREGWTTLESSFEHYQKQNVPNRSLLITRHIWHGYLQEIRTLSMYRKRMSASCTFI